MEIVREKSSPGFSVPFLLGQLGLDGFFLISGYLITESYQKSRSSGEYLLKRILRIYPGYVVAYLICILAVGPFVGGQFAAILNPKLWLAIPLLHDPNMPGVFPVRRFSFSTPLCGQSGTNFVVICSCSYSEEILGLLSSAIHNVGADSLCIGPVGLKIRMSWHNIFRQSPNWWCSAIPIPVSGSQRSLGVALYIISMMTASDMIGG